MDYKKVLECLKLKHCRLNLEKQKGPSTSTKGAASHKGASVFNTHDCDETEGLAQLVPIIQETSLMVNEAIQKHLCVNGVFKCSSDAVLWSISFYFFQFFNLK